MWVCLLFGPILHLGFYFEAVCGCFLDPVDAFDKSELRIWQGLARIHVFSFYI